MICLLSPAKSLDFETPFDTGLMTQPRLFEHTAILAEQARQLDPETIAELMDLSSTLAELNYQRFQDFEAVPGKRGRKCALLAFSGDVYQGLEAQSWTEETLLVAQNRIRILSGLYGLLRPLDGILPYRLEMGRKLETLRGKTLYAFWGQHITDLLNQDLEETGARAVINLASQEYFKAIKPKALAKPLITVDFKEERDGKLKTISFSAKRARGMMARYLVDLGQDSLEALKGFDKDGYGFDASGSSADYWLFIRPDQRKL